MRASVFENDGSISETELRAAQPRRNPREFIAVRRFAAVGSPVARLLLIPHKVSSLRCGTLWGPRIRVVKMRRRSLRSSFLRNYRKALSFSLRVNEIGQERRTEGIAIVTQSVDRVIPPPRGPRRKYFRWG